MVHRDKRNLVIMGVAGVVLLGLIIGLWSVIRVIKRDNRLRAQESETINLALHIDNGVFKKYLGISRLLAANPRIIALAKGITEPDNREVLIVLESGHRLFGADLVYVTDTQGTVVGCTPYGGGKTLTGKNYSFRPYFKKAMAGGEIVYPAVGVTTNKRGLYFSSPIYAELESTARLEQPIGVQVCKVGLNQVDQYLAAHQGSAALVSPDGIVFATNKKEWLFRAAWPLAEDKRRALMEGRQFADHPLTPLPTSLDGKTVRLAGQPHSVISEPVSLLGWRIITVAPDSADYPLTQSQIRVIVEVSIVTAVLCLVVILMWANMERRKTAEQITMESKARLESILHGAHRAAIIALDPTGRITEFNTGAERMLGYWADEVVGRESLLHFHLEPEVEEHGRVLSRRLGIELKGTAILVELARRGSFDEREWTWIRKSGEHLSVILNVTPLRDGSERIIGYLGVGIDNTARRKDREAVEQARDQLEERVRERTADLSRANESLREEISERARVEEELRRSEERHRVVLETAPDPILVYDMEGWVIYVNPAFTRTFGWTADECLMSEFTFVPEEDVPENEEILAAIRSGKWITGVESKRITTRGRTIDVSLSGAAFFDDNGGFRGSVLNLRDITAWKEAERKLTHLAYHDPLTGLPNRKSFYERLEETLAQAARSSEAKLRAILFLDLDRFKEVNDTLGHDIGDELLKEASIRISDCLRKSDHCFRLGGDEFTVILNYLSKDIDAAKVAQHINSALAQPFRVNGYEIYSSASIGVSVHPTDGETVESLIKNADTAMYAAKADRVGYRFYTEAMNSEALDRMRLENDLRRAVERDELVIHYQPLYEKSGPVAGLEALVRWDHPEKGLIMPDSFIPLAEETDLILPLGEWVLYRACEQAVAWREAGHQDLFVAVNLSAKQFRHPTIVDDIETVLTRTGLSPTQLKLEVTESCVMEDPEGAVAKMDRLNRLGIRFSIDDFGTGYSSLAYLKRFPVDTLKIDKSFIKDLGRDTDDEEIVKTIIGMATTLNLETVAEGVETEDQQDLLAEHGCLKMQGYLFSKPLPADMMSRLLAECRVQG